MPTRFWSALAGTEAYLLDVIAGRKRGLAPSLIRGLLAILAVVYSAGLKLFLLPYGIGIRKRARLPCKVISVGNLTVGGSGKTPITRLVCEILQSQGKKVCILSRGYHGRHEFGAHVVDQSDPSAGDEAVMLARQLPETPVLVGKDRRVTGRMAVERFKPDVIVLDDGMQFYQLHRDMDITLIDARRPFDNGWTFPRGLLREPPSHLARAGCVIVTNGRRQGNDEIRGLNDRIRRFAPRATMLAAEYEPVILRDLDTGQEHPLKWLNGRAVTTSCALGNPQGFEQQVELLGAAIAHRVRYPDHYAPTSDDLAKTSRESSRLGSESVIITEKDAVKINSVPPGIPWLVLIATMAVNDRNAFADTLMEIVRQ